MELVCNEAARKMRVVSHSRTKKGIVNSDKNAKKSINLAEIKRVLEEDSPSVGRIFHS